ncbi:MULTISPECIES: NAD-dependent epimerase/dehydratase family protein [unclassified Sphingomonas]|uniref:NAD-dependent epimerase/dehydratase family protein n=1 Tax=unclassified Sphingomonas TaxID=196159 RepID=UPI000AAB354B|nr:MULTISPECIES: NAD-dependent epimerase/dehydratase family protein [unclassified Sphingomonas]MBN8849636.1 NAD-dependent epimerase/dehydratase family protein [Sphingomonas sp.]
MNDSETARGDRRRVWITGANGMVGRNLREHPKAAGWEILAPSRRNLDLGDRRATADFARTMRPDLVIHAAGQVGGIQANMADPVGFLVNNLDMGRNVIMGAFEAGVPSLINLSSSCMYPRGRDHALRESDMMTGELEPTNEGYALAKIVSARLCDYIARTRPDLAYRTLIPCNLYGRHDKFDPAASHLVPAIVAKISQAVENGKDNVEIWGDGTARREFMYAADLADAVWRAADNTIAMPQLMNIGIGKDYTILEYYEAVAAALGWKGHFRFDLSRPVGMQRKLSDVSRQREWGWNPPTSLLDGIAATIQFYHQQA